MIDQILKESTMLKLLTSLLIVILNGLSNVSAQDAENTALVNDFIDRISKREGQSVTANARYPVLIIERDGSRKKIRNVKEFEKGYSRIFDKELSRAIRCIDKSDIFINSQGLMIGNGTLWFDLPDSNGNLFLMTINKHAAKSVRC